MKCITFLTGFLILLSNVSFAASLGETCVNNGSTRIGYLQQVTSGDVPCPTGTQVCIAGEWTGPMLFDTCENYTKSCDGILHGMPVTGYLTPTTPKDVPCITATKVCLNGEWSGPEVFASCTELP